MATWCIRTPTTVTMTTSISTPNPNPQLAVNAATVLANIPQRQLQVIDARSADRFRGENETLDPVAGHIPGALNRFFKDNLDAVGSFKNPDTLRAEFNALLGERPPQTVVHQCGSGVTACHNLLAMEVAALHGSRLYPGSWSEWVSDRSRPVAAGARPMLEGCLRVNDMGWGGHPMQHGFNCLVAVPTNNCNLR